MIVAQYSVYAIAGPEPDYGIHFPNIRSPEGWQKDDARAPGMLRNNASPTSPEKRSNRFHKHSANYLNRNSERILHRFKIPYAESASGKLQSRHGVTG